MEGWGKGLDPVRAFERLRTPPYSYLLESVGGVPETSRYSILGSRPEAVIRGKGARIERHEKGRVSRLKDTPFGVLRTLTAEFSLSRGGGTPPFFGGIIGFFAYDLARFIEHLPSPPKDDLDCPDFVFLLVDTVVVFDHELRKADLIHTPLPEAMEKMDREALYRQGAEKLEDLLERLSRPGTGTSPAREALPAPDPDMTRDEYIRMVERCREYIAAGDIYQANLSQRFSVPFNGDPWRLYQALRAINPSPFSGYLELDDFQLISASPERLIRLKEGVLDTRPIAGTRPRGKTGREDEGMRVELLTSEKERAEHLMLVDLERNDLGRVSETGSVTVNELMTVEGYSHVLHIVSNIRGRLSPGKSPADVIEAVFPGGTITGVPKVRCMEIISELEPFARGPYTGSFGYISLSGELDLNIIIRSFLIKNKTAFFQVGGGIVADSDPFQEYDETIYKAAALMKALSGEQ
ncbi:MAG TPA: aminodeoxychorismate synthase component I [Nitrospiria bacterium]